MVYLCGALGVAALFDAWQPAVAIPALLLAVVTAGVLGLLARELRRASTRG
jgi:hypothetical protein